VAAGGELMPANELTMHLPRSANRRVWQHAFHFSSMALSIGLAIAAMANAQVKNSKPGEYEVKAVYLYNFGKFIRWPANTTSTQAGSFAICVLGEDPFGSSLNSTVNGETINGTNIVATRISKPEDAGSCHIVFISSSEEGRLKEILSRLNCCSVLTVSDLPQFSQHGGMVGFVLDGKKVRFEVNLAPAEHAGLTLSSELLKLAATVRKSPGD
jgi:hypothetical protein